MSDRSEAAMIQDLDNQFYSNDFRPRPPREGDVMLIFPREGKKLCLIEYEGEYILPEARDFAEYAPDQGKGDFPFGYRLQYLFSVDSRAYFTLLYAPESETLEIPEFDYVDLTFTRKSGPQELRFAASTGWQLFRWYSDNTYCGRCGSRMTVGKELRNVICPACGNMVFPKIMPAVIVGVINGGKLLMTRYAGREFKGYALIAGFCEIGETGEDTVRREVMEEAGIRVKNIRYYKSQPWGYESDLLLGYFCDLDGDPTITLDDGELSVAEWVPREAITEEYQNMSLTNEMICVFRDGKEPKV